ncbi:MAG: site-specific integrase [Tannerellaceae bacterium]|nr:site-specific integrase [Tannerellaceae bacterium]
MAEEELIEKKLNTDFIQFALELNKRNCDLGKIAYSTFQNDQSSIILFKKYLVLMTKNVVLPVRDLSLNLFEKYKTYCLGRPNKKESINKKLKPLFKAVKHAADSELIRGDIVAKILNDGRETICKRCKGQKDTLLTKHQLQEFSNLYYTVKFARTRQFIDIFMFSFYACGLRFSDLLTLEWNHVVWERKEIRKNLYKGNVTTTIPLLPGGTEILRRWQNLEYNTRFVFNVLPENFDLHNIAELDKSRKSKNLTLLTSLNELGHKLSSKLPFNLSIHVARHTFAVLAINEGLNLYIISKLLVIDQSKLLRRYMQPFWMIKFRMRLVLNSILIFDPSLKIK